MKKPSTFQASNSLLGTALLLSLLGTAMISGLDGFAELYAVCKSLWHNFSKSLSMIQPHRTVFPK